MPRRYLMRCTDCGHVEERYCNSQTCRICLGRLERVQRKEPVNPIDANAILGENIWQTVQELGPVTSDGMRALADDMTARGLYLLGQVLYHIADRQAMEEVASGTRFVIPGELTSLNEYIRAERASLHAAADIKREETGRVCLHAKEQGVRSVQHPVHITIYWYVPNRRKDLDNVVFAKKFIFDGLVAAEVLPTDGWRWIRGITDIPDVDGDNPRIEVVIRELTGVSGL